MELVFTVTEISRLKALEKLCIYPEDGLFDFEPEINGWQKCKPDQR